LALNYCDYNIRPKVRDDSPYKLHMIRELTTKLPKISISLLNVSTMENERKINKVKEEKTKILQLDNLCVKVQ